jgi:Na+/H+ antiporter NhaC
MAFGWLSLVPSLLTIGLAIATRRVVLSLMLGLVAGTLILLPGPTSFFAQSPELAGRWDRYLLASLLLAAEQLAEEHLWTSLADSDHLRVFVFTSLLGIQVALIHHSGGMRGVIASLAGAIHSRRRSLIVTWLLGLVIFIDDYANSLLVGSTMRPLTDRWRVSREKLAYLVDSTSAPVAGLALVSTWVAGEISYMLEGFANAGVDLEASAFGIFVQTLPYRFYPLFALLLVWMVIWSGRDFEPMASAEQRCRSGLPPRWQSATDELPVETLESQPVTASLIANGLLPLAVTLLVTLGLLWHTGQTLWQERLSGSLTPGPSGGWQTWADIIGNGDSYLALVYGSLAGLICIVLLMLAQGQLRTTAWRQAALGGWLQVLPALVILWLAWALSRLTGQQFLDTGSFLASQLGESLPIAWLPTVSFLLAAGVAFATGTSWGTMGIVMPIVIPLAFQLGQLQNASLTADAPVMLASIGSVLAGAIFGDHCSPISDTTILSSRASGCDHIAHVRTQLPYAGLAGAVAIAAGTLPAGWGVSPWLTLPLGGLALWLCLRLFGRSTAADQGPE